MKYTIRVALCLCCLLRAADSSAAMIIQGYNSNLHDRFNNNASFIGNPYDWSGVGRGTAGRWGTMISPNYFVSVDHFAPSPGGTLRFYYTNDPAGAFEDRTILSGTNIAGSDLWLGKLTAPVSSSVAKYPILDLPSTSDYENRTIFTFGITGSTPGTATDVRLGRNQIDPGTFGPFTLGTTGEIYLFDYDNPGGVGADESMVQSGDSGGPSFNLAEGLYPALVGVHWFQYTDPPHPSGSADTFVPYYITELQAAMGGDTLTLVPEPSGFVLILVGGAALVAFSRRFRRRPAA